MDNLIEKEACMLTKKALGKLHPIISISSILVLWLALSPAMLQADAAHWVNSGPPGPVYAICVDPQDSATIFAATSAGVFKSINRGGNWSAINVGLTSYYYVYALAIDLQTPTTLYAGTDGGVFKSSNGGGSWSAVNTGWTSSTVYALAIDPQTPATLYAGTNGGGIFKSSNGGANWSASSMGLANSAGFSSLAIDPLTPTTLYAGTDYGGVFKSSNGGGNWSAINTGLTDNSVLALAIDPQTPTTLYAGTVRGGVFKSSDGGGNWSAVNTGLTKTDMRAWALAIDPRNPSTVYAGTDGGVHKSSNGAEDWDTNNTGLACSGVKTLAIDPQNPALVYAGTKTGIFKSWDGGTTWKPINEGLISLNKDFDVGFIAIDPQNPVTVYAGMWGGGAFKSTNRGESWSAISQGLPSSSIWVLAINPQNSNVIYAGTDRDGLFKTVNGGQNWNAVNNGLTSFLVATLAIDPQHPDTIYAGTGSNGTGVSGLFKSTDGGANWSRLYGSAPSIVIPALAIDPHDPSTLYAAVWRRGVFKTNDGGLNWSEADTGLPSYAPVDTLVIDPQNPATLYAGLYDSDSGHVFKSTNGGESWSAIDTGITVRDILVLAIDPQTPSTLFAGGFGTVFRYQMGARVSQIVPIVLEARTARDYFKTDLALTNKGKKDATVRMRFTASLGQQQGSGTISETVQAGQQLEIPHVISYLREKGLGLPVEANPVQGGTLLLEVEGLEQENDFAVVARTTTDTRDPQPVGRAGLAYSSLVPAISPSKVYIYGLRANVSDRSNLAVYNMSTESLTFKVSVFSGDGDTSEHVITDNRELPAYGWTQFNQVLASVGLSNGYAAVERLSPTGVLGAYGVVNDNATGDGSFVPAMGEEMKGNRLVLPVLVEAGSFESELVLCNRSEEVAQLTLDYVESLSPSEGVGGAVTVSLLPGEQKIIPSAVDFLRTQGLPLGQKGASSRAGSLRISVSGTPSGFIFAGARTSSLSSAGGQYGLFYTAVYPGMEAEADGYLFGLVADAENRSNVAIIHLGDSDSGHVTLELQVYDGENGGTPAGAPVVVGLEPGEWHQEVGLLAQKDVNKGWVEIRRISGTAPWYGYGVINDGGAPGQRTGDGAFIASAP
jgi:photosystem II stability/assembly factor-like uncharacterized protein